MSSLSDTGEPPPKRQRTDNGTDGNVGPAEDEAAARRKLEEAHFDPDDVAAAITPPHSAKPPGVGSWYAITPMTYFSYYGDLPMCRYILNHGGDASKSGQEFWFPMYAAVHRGHLDVCKWLFENGAQKDVRTGTGRLSLMGHRPLSCCWRSPGDRLAIRKWLLLNGAAQDGSGNFIRRILQRDLLPRKLKSGYSKWVDDRPELLAWSQTMLQTRLAFHAFLMGTGTPSATKPDAADEGKTSFIGTDKNVLDEQNPRGRSPVECVSGNIGVLKCIAVFVGVCDSKQLQVHQQLSRMLPIILEDDPPRGEVRDREKIRDVAS
ncbi:Ankyrin Repeat Protein [Seminavis robusta]|uniref:Ankyrin Repeat Protein n=1 Tax=Seminavis robusta TaxID=568900 RepID=A0A9N8EE03_9STRA|nr:Ankyrin Repeat Protein [Seminavis robusta]|eukprot:Sro985_g228040.1 Ankyrin Repeat Protein (320) ;mRNA; f:26311-27270